ncbi:hypothetical protein N9Y63_01805 [Akkermansiaceae bacterium]|nr:hypothetical protein [Akkermansiaceae bacterium]MDB2639574.1 hypothetical protein [Akkermansiaceae bacterium]
MRIIASESFMIGASAFPASARPFLVFSSPQEDNKKQNNKTGNEFFIAQQVSDFSLVAKRKLLGSHLEAFWISRGIAFGPKLTRIEEAMTAGVF